MPTLYTAGYGRWPTRQRIAALTQALKDAGVTTLVDVRHSPCSSNLDAASNYGPRSWHLLAAEGIESSLPREGIDYLWLVELGNPQKNDRGMRILRAHLDSGDERWPVNRGLRLLAQPVKDDKRCCLLCACADYEKCHRKILAETLAERFFDKRLELVDLSRPKSRGKPRTDTGPTPAVVTRTQRRR